MWRETDKSKPATVNMKQMTCCGVWRAVPFVYVIWCASECVMKSARRTLAAPLSQRFRSWLVWKVYFPRLRCNSSCCITWPSPIHLAPMWFLRCKRVAVVCTLHYVAYDSLGEAAAAEENQRLAWCESDVSDPICIIGQAGSSQYSHGLQYV